MNSTLLLAIIKSSEKLSGTFRYWYRYYHHYPGIVKYNLSTQRIQVGVHYIFLLRDPSKHPGNMKSV